KGPLLDTAAREQRPSAPSSSSLSTPPPSSRISTKLSSSPLAQAPSPKSAISAVREVSGSAAVTAITSVSPSEISPKKGEATALAASRVSFGSASLDSTAQPELQPSPLASLPSSQPSPTSRMPSPHAIGRERADS